MNKHDLFHKQLNYVWLLAFIFSLMCMIPAINAINTRVIFFPLIFLFIFFLKIIFLNYNYNYNIKTKTIFFYIFILLFFLESFLGAITSYSFKKEYDERIEILNEAKLKSKNYAIVSHYKIIPSRLNHIPRPNHDRDDLNYLSKLYEIKISYDNSFPRSKNIRKNIKFFFNSEKKH